MAFWKGNPKSFRSTARRIASSRQLQDYLDAHTDMRRKETRQAKQLLAIAARYEAEIKRAIEASGYRAAYGEVFDLVRRIDRIVIMIYKCQCRTFEGVAIKALALLVAVNADAVGDFIAHRSNLLYATKLADDLVKLRPTAGKPLHLQDRGGRVHA